MVLDGLLKLLNNVFTGPANIVEPVHDTSTAIRVFFLQVDKVIEMIRTGVTLSRKLNEQTGETHLLALISNKSAAPSCNI
jgi:hypothetical protein